MKKLPIIFVLALIQTTTAFPQSGRRGQLSFSLGPSVPIGQFAGTNLFDGTSGFAKPGEAIAISYDRAISGKIYFHILLTGQRNPINRKGFEDALASAKIYQGFYIGFNLSSSPPQTSYSTFPD